MVSLVRPNPIVAVVVACISSVARQISPLCVSSGWRKSCPMQIEQCLCSSSQCLSHPLELYVASFACHNCVHVCLADFVLQITLARTQRIRSLVRSPVCLSVCLSARVQSLSSNTALTQSFNLSRPVRFQRLPSDARTQKSHSLEREALKREEAIRSEEEIC